MQQSMEDDSGDNWACFETEQVFVSACNRDVGFPEPDTLWSTLAVVGSLLVLIVTIASVRGTRCVGVGPVSD